MSWRTLPDPGPDPAEHGPAHRAGPHGPRRVARRRLRQRRARSPGRSAATPARRRRPTAAAPPRPAETRTGVRITFAFSYSVVFATGDRGTREEPCDAVDEPTRHHPTPLVPRADGARRRRGDRRHTRTFVMDVPESLADLYHYEPGQFCTVRAAHRRRRRDALLFDVERSGHRRPARRHGEARARRPGVELAPRPRGARRRTRADAARRCLLRTVRRRRSDRRVLRRQRGHARVLDRQAGAPPRHTSRPAVLRQSRPRLRHLPRRHRRTRRRAPRPADRAPSSRRRRRIRVGRRDHDVPRRHRRGRPARLHLWPDPVHGPRRGGCRGGRRSRPIGSPSSGS